ncbi:hypothetical protein SLEP1_g34391 [Rubroshorea leprosula]|uniref:Uncharacterized protein n=1 Tax=Rubroshorea leprosula TaxID=152421 RepID=A0AAV5KK11_9ROSI|nr:hypothetical protein SLEP1_g34391 [Rubroshorea leprosula]
MGGGGWGVRWLQRVGGEEEQGMQTQPPTERRDMVAGKVRMAMGLQKSPANSDQNNSPKPPLPSPSSAGKNSAASPADVTELLRLVEELRDRESKLKTQLLEFKLLKESVAIVPVLENEIDVKNAELEGVLKENEDLKCEKEALEKEMEEMKREIEAERKGREQKMRELKAEVAELETRRKESEKKQREMEAEIEETETNRKESEIKIKEMEAEIAELKKIASEKGRAEMTHQSLRICIKTSKLSGNASIIELFISYFSTQDLLSELYV